MYSEANGEELDKKYRLSKYLLPYDKANKYRFWIIVENIC